MTLPPQKNFPVTPLVTEGPNAVMIASKHKKLECVLEDVWLKWCQFWVFLGPGIFTVRPLNRNTFLRGESVLMGRSLLYAYDFAPTVRK